jgi:hypothetical protein
MQKPGLFLLLHAEAMVIFFTVCIAEAIVTFIGLECSHLTNLISA